MILSKICANKPGDKDNKINAKNINFLNFFIQCN